MRLCFRASPIAQMSGAVSVRHGNSCLTREGCGPGTRRDRPGSRTALAAAAGAKMGMGPRLQRSLRQGPCPAGTVLLWWKIGFKYRFQHQHCCRHADPITQGRDAQRPEFAIGLRYVYSSDGIRSVSLLPERKRQFVKPSLHPILFDVREVLAVHPRCALVGAAFPPPALPGFRGTSPSVSPQRPAGPSWASG